MTVQPSDLERALLRLREAEMIFEEVLRGGLNGLVGQQQINYRIREAICSGKSMGEFL